jgi:hypothetical protein
MLPPEHSARLNRPSESYHPLPAAPAKGYATGSPYGLKQDIEYDLDHPRHRHRHPLS